MLRGWLRLWLLTALACALLSRPSFAQQTPAPVIAPKPLSALSAAYPEGAQGTLTVVLTLTVEADGSVTGVTADPLTEPFASQAQRAAAEWRFEPAQREGKAIRARIRVQVVFEPPAPEPEPEPEPEPTVVPAPEPVPGAAPAAKKPPARAVEIEVRGLKMEPSRTASLSRAEVRQIPGTFGDPFRAIEIMPGVTPIVSGLPFFFVRGAPPGNVGYFLDGIRVPLLFHIGVGPSVIHPALIERVDLYPGGYPARFGRFSGGIVSGETAPPAPDLHGEYNLRVFDAGAMVETPFADHRGQLLLAGRYSYTAGLLSLLSSNVKLDYWDYQGRASYALGPKDTLSVFSFGSYDYLGERSATQEIALFGAEFHRVDTRWDHEISPDARVRLGVTAGIDRSRLPDERFVRDRSLAARSEVVLQASRNAIVRFGADAMLDSYDVQLGRFDLGPAAARAAALFPTRTDLATGVRADVVLALTRRFTVTPGVRVDYYASQGQSAVGVDPRFSTRLQVSERLSLLSTFGLAHQPPAFVVPVPGFQPGGLRGGLQLAVQQSAGVEYDLGDATNVTATVFHNGFFDMSDPIGTAEQRLGGCAPGTFPSDTLAGDRGATPTGNGSPCGTPRFPVGTVGPDRSGGGGQAAESAGGTRAADAISARTNGAAYGLELFLKRRLTSRVGGFLSYTLSRSIRTFENREFVATFDRTHVVNAAISYNLGRNWRAGTRVMFYTGLPKVPDPTDPGATRLPPFFRLDLRLEKRWQLSRRMYLSFVAEWMNATLSKEAVATTCTLQGCDTRTVGPITIPSLGLEGGF